MQELNLNGLQSILGDNNWNPYEICLLGLFENIGSKDLVKRKIKITWSKKRINWVEVDEEYFKDKIINMKLICEALGISINTLRHLQN